ncbi:hypothetical protein ACFQ36_08125 [Arthrobacter sp. GCM10027362]|uniref:hypothetical protein n=1 Tax=Arthrobacter sp. GCM10027362 TaxID=3273379 RepID=UPI00363368FA
MEIYIKRVEIYSARYGNLRTWPLEEALETLAGEPVDLEDERRVVLAKLVSVSWQAAGPCRPAAANAAFA